MTVQWFEESGSRSASVKRLGTKDKSSCSVKYRALGTMSDIDVHNYANAFFTTNRFYTINGVTYLVASYELTHLGGDAWEVVATYESQGGDGEEPLKRSRSFDTGGATTHISVGFAERRYGANAPNMDGAINVDDETVNGVDIVVPQLQWQEQYDVPSFAITDSYIRFLADLTGCVNTDAFRGFSAGEVLFLGASGSQQADEEIGLGPWSLTFKFSASANISNLSLGGIGGIEKKGHEYLWVRYEPSESQGKLIRKPQHVYVNEVYRKASFSGLGIG